MAATVMADSDLICLGTPVDSGSGCVEAGIGLGATARRDREDRDRRLMIVPAHKGA